MFKQSLRTAVVTQVHETVALVGDGQILAVAFLALTRALGADQTGGLSNREMDMGKID